MRERTEVVFRGEWANYMHDYNVNRIREVVSFELSKEIQKDVFLSCLERGTKKTFWVPMKNRTSDFRIPRSDALPLSYRDSTLSEVFVHYPVFMVPCWEWILQIKNRHQRERPQTLLIGSRKLWRQTLDVQLKCTQLNDEKTSYKEFLFFPRVHKIYFINPSAFRALDASINVHIITSTSV